MKGRFAFTGKITEPTMGFLRGQVSSMEDNDPNATSFYLEPTRMKIVVKFNLFKKAKVAGSKTQVENEKLNAQISQIKDTGAVYIAKVNRVLKSFIYNHSNSYVSVFKLLLNRYRWPFDTVRLLYERLDPGLVKSYYGIPLTASVNEMRENSAGRPAKEFSTLDINNSPLQLTMFKGKYILLDFWASWCVPCRISVPNFLKLYDKYHTKGLEIIAISVDKDSTAWRNAVRVDHTEIWYHIRSDGGTKDTVNIANKYGVRFYPTKMLINREGTIIGRYSGTEEDHLLNSKLSELMGE